MFAIIGLILTVFLAAVDFPCSQIDLIDCISVLQCGVGYDENTKKFSCVVDSCFATSSSSSLSCGSSCIKSEYSGVYYCYNQSFYKYQDDCFFKKFSGGACTIKEDMDEFGEIELCIEMDAGSEKVCVEDVDAFCRVVSNEMCTYTAACTVQGNQCLMDRCLATGVEYIPEIDKTKCMQSGCQKTGVDIPDEGYEEICLSPGHIIDYCNVFGVPKLLFEQEICDEFGCHGYVDVPLPNGVFSVCASEVGGGGPKLPAVDPGVEAECNGHGRTNCAGDLRCVLDASQCVGDPCYQEVDAASECDSRCSSGSVTIDGEVQYFCHMPSHSVCEFYAEMADSCTEGSISSSIQLSSHVSMVAFLLILLAFLF